MMHRNLNTTDCIRLALWLLAVLLTTSLGAGQAAEQQESVPSLWHQSISITRLTEYKQSERLVISDIWSGTPGQDAAIKHSLKVKVNVWGRPFTTASGSADKKGDKETLSVTLYKTTNPMEISVHFEHIVYEKGEVKLRFCGITRVPRI
jgi:hypothetical protein